MWLLSAATVLKYFLHFLHRWRLSLIPDDFDPLGCGSFLAFFLFFALDLIFFRGGLAAPLVLLFCWDWDFSSAQQPQHCRLLHTRQICRTESFSGTSRTRNPGTDRERKMSCRGSFKKNSYFSTQLRVSRWRELSRARHREIFFSRYMATFRGSRHSLS